MVKGTVTGAALAGASSAGAGGRPGGGGGELTNPSRTSLILPSASGPVGPRPIELRARATRGFRLARLPRLSGQTPEMRAAQSSAATPTAAPQPRVFVVVRRGVSRKAGLSGLPA